MDLKNLASDFNYIFTLFVIFPLILVAGGYLSFHLRFVQLRKLKISFSCLTQKNKEAQGTISRFEALSSVLAGNFGTGNISGMAIAITAGGPGALVWMWIMVFFATAIQYTSCVLGVAYRCKNSQGEYVGGPMYYLKNGLGLNTLAVCFAIFTLFGAITVGNFAQIHSITMPLETIGFNPLYCSLFITLFAAFVIVGGIKRFARFSSLIVPIKAVLYLGCALIILSFHGDKIIPAFLLMFDRAFDFSALSGGITGSLVLKAITNGFERGLFATDAGTGIVPILQAGAKSSDPETDGISTLLSPLMVMIVCTMTGLVLIVTGAFETDLQSTNMVIYAFSEGLGSRIGGYIVIIALLLFAFTTILAWSYCAEKALEFLFGNKFLLYFRLLFVCLIPLGTLISLDLIWSLADIAISLMLLFNLIGVLLLSKQVINSSYADYYSNIDLKTKI